MWSSRMTLLHCDVDAPCTALWCNWWTGETIMDASLPPQWLWAEPGSETARNMGVMHSGQSQPTETGLEDGAP